MKRTWVLASALALMLITAACSGPPMTDMTLVQGDQYSTIQWEGRTYIPYAPLEKDALGKQIGILNGDDENMVYVWKDHEPEEWIINRYTEDGQILFREENVTEIPSGLVSEYWWNTDVAPDGTVSAE